MDPPWTADPILQQYRFCNVRRRHDKVSKWIIDNVIDPYDKHPNLWVMLALARYVNHPDTIAELMMEGLWPESIIPDWRAIGACIDARTARGYQTWTGAYMIRAESNPKAEWYSWGKGRYVAEKVIGRELWANRDVIAPQLYTVQRAHEAICGRYGWGSFMTGQLVADLTYSFWLRNALDLYTWAPLGPGSQRGLNRLAGRPLTTAMSQPQAVKEMIIHRDAIVDAWPEFHDMTLHDVQNCLCETDKYLRTQNGEGRPRSHYTPHA